jgi:hypothetical protein
MADKKDEQVCNHEECTCKVRDDSDYCSPYCEAASKSNVIGVACECGHPDCAAELHA